MLKTYNFIISDIGKVSVSADSWKEAESLIQYYLEKHSLNKTYHYEPI